MLVIDVLMLGFIMPNMLLLFKCYAVDIDLIISEFKYTIVKVHEGSSSMWLCEILKMLE